MIRLLLLSFAMLLTACGSEPPGPGMVVSFDYDVDEPGLVSLAVYGSQGQMLRTLLAGEPHAAGTYTAAWDGLDRFGRPAAPGNYQWRLLRTPGFQAEYLLTVGNRRPDGGWREWIGNHGHLHAIASDGEWVFAGGMGENVPGSGAFRLADGTVRWLQGNRIAWGTVTGAAFVRRGDTPVIVNLVSNQTTSQVRIFDPATGNAVAKPIDVLLPADAETRWAGTRYGFAAADDVVAISYPAAKLVRWYGLDPEAEPLAEVTVEAPGMLTMKPDGKLFMVAEGGVVILDRDGRTTPVIAAETLVEPQAIAYQPQTDTLLIAEHGDIRQVRRYDAASGRLVAAHGRQGGRRYGPYHPEDFRDVHAICPDGQGGFLAVEGGRSVRRIAHFDADGQLVRDWPTGQQFFNFATFDPADPSIVIYRPDPLIKAVAQCDYDAGTWRITHEFEHDRFGTQLMPTGGHYSTNWRAIRRGGELYLWCDSGPRSAIVRVDLEAGRLVPLVAAGGTHGFRADEGGPYFTALEAAGKTMKEAPVYIWSDTDGNGEVDAAEVQVGDFFSPWGAQTCFVDADLNLYRGGANGNITLLRNTTPDGPRPTWSPDAVEIVAVQPHPETGQFGAGETTGLRVEPDGTVYRVFAANGFGHDRPANGWPTLTHGTDRIVRYRPDGSIAWVAARHASRSPSNLANPSDRDQLHDDVGIIGRVRKTIIVADRVVTPAGAWTEDGLYAGSFFDRHVDDGLPGEVYHWWRDPYTAADGPVPYDLKTKGSVIEVPGGAIWAPMGEQNSPIYRVTGWDGWERQSGTLTITETPPHAAFDGRGLTAEYFAAEEPGGEAVAALVEPQIWHDWPDRGRHHGTWRKGIPGELSADAPFAVRWTGTLTPHLSERFVFAPTNRSIPSPTVSERWHDDWGGVRIWLGGRLILDNWRGTRERGHRPESAPIALLAGRPYKLRIEYTWRGTGKENAHPECSVVWESRTQERQRLPTALLTPLPPADLPTVRIEASGSLSETAPDTATFTIVADRPPATDLDVHLQLAGGVSATDLEAAPLAALIPAGQTRSNPIVLRAVDDALIDGAERAGYALAIRPEYLGNGSDTAVTVPLADDEGGPVEGMLGHFTFDRIHLPVVANDAGPNAPAGHLSTHVAQSSDNAVSGRSIQLAGRQQVTMPLPTSEAPLPLPYTMALWFHTEGEDSGLARVWRHGLYEVGLWLRERRVCAGHNRRQPEATDAAVIGPGWHHAALVVKADIWELYVDGQPAGECKPWGQEPPVRSAFQFGPNVNYRVTRPEAVVAPLLLDDVRFYHRALDAADIAALFTATRPAE